MVGCVFGGWADFAITFEEAAQWLDHIMKLSRQENPNPSVTTFSDQIKSSYFWLSYLWDAVQRLRQCNDIDRKFALQLYALGQRRPKFLSGQLQHPPPLFGLSNMSDLLPMMKNCEHKTGHWKPWPRRYLFAQLIPLPESHRMTIGHRLITQTSMAKSKIVSSTPLSTSHSPSMICH